LPGARAGALPRLAVPQLATLVTGPPRGEGWLHEVKFDGYRILARVERGRVRLLSRNGKDWTARFALIARAAAGLPVRTALVDGEVAMLQEDGTTSFSALQNSEGGGEGTLVYFVFDLLHQDGYDLGRVPLEDRKRALARLVGRPSGPVRYSAHVVGGGERFFALARRRAQEGIVSKRRDAPYVSGRSRDWLKIKCGREQEFVIGGFTEPEGTREGLGALLLGVYDAGALRYAGKVGTGFSAATATALRRRLEARRRQTCPFAERPPGLGQAHWVSPDLVAEVAFTEWTSDGRLRHPSFKGLRQDKDPREIVREVPAAASAGPEPPSPGRVRSAGSRPPRRAGGRA
jgi:bifunctional non-homologous end joining protein LigD